MKKVLLTTSALTMIMSGAAFAEVKIGGSARIGIEYNGTAGAQEWDVEKRTTFNIDASTSTDNGLTLGARIRLRSDEGTAASGVSASYVYVGNDVFKLTVGNHHSAIETLPGLYANSVGLTGLGWNGLPTNDQTTGTFDWSSFSSGGGGSDVVRLDASFGGADFVLAYADFNNSTSSDDELSASIAYNFGDWTVAVAHQDVDGTGTTVATIGGSFGNFDVDLGFADNDGTNKWTVGVGTSLDSGLGLRAYVSDEDATGQDMVFGLGATYSLGGAVLVGGVTQTESGDTRADFGIRTSF